MKHLKQLITLTLLLLAATTYSQLINDAHTKYFYTWDTTNGGVVDTTSPTGFSRNFIGNKFIDSTNLSTTFPEYREQSFEFWIYIPSEQDTVGVSIKSLYLIYKVMGYNIILNREGTSLSFCFGQYTTEYYGYNTPQFPTLFDDKWHLVSFVVDVNNQNIKFYLDGNLIVNRTYGLFSWYTDRDYSYTYIGCTHTYSTTFLGRMATIRISDTLRTASVWYSTVYKNTPVFISEPICEATVKTKYRYTPNATDLDIPIGDSLVYSLITYPWPGMYMMDNEIIWTPKADEVGEHTVTIKVKDMADRDTTQTFIITVSPQQTSFEDIKITNTGFSLEQNNPNPFNPTTTINYSIPNNGHVLLNVYSVSGKLIQTLTNTYLPKGHYSACFNNDTWQNNCSGVYIYRLIYGNNTITKRMLLAK